MFYVAEQISTLGFPPSPIPKINGKSRKRQRIIDLAVGVGLKLLFGFEFKVLVGFEFKVLVGFEFKHSSYKKD